MMNFISGVFLYFSNELHLLTQRSTVYRFWRPNGFFRTAEKNGELGSWQQIFLRHKRFVGFNFMQTKGLQNILLRIGTGLSVLRVQKGYDNISDFANEHNLPLIQYWRIEKGKANVTLKSLVKLLTIHQLAPEEFFCWLRDADIK